MNVACLVESSVLHGGGRFNFSILVLFFKGCPLLVLDCVHPARAAHHSQPVTNEVKAVINQILLQKCECSTGRSCCDDKHKS